MSKLDELTGFLTAHNNPSVREAGYKMKALIERVESQRQEIDRLKAQNEIMKAQRTEQISENQLLKAENEKLRELARLIELLLSDIPEGDMTTQEKGILNGARKVLGE